MFKKSNEAPDKKPLELEELTKDLETLLEERGTCVLAHQLLNYSGGSCDAPHNVYEAYVEAMNHFECLKNKFLSKLKTLVNMTPSFPVQYYKK